ncbi:MAG TPA: hypothetical protein VEU51_17930 [Candidatus Acidoferrales bacterium]|nr:hypothetical protein [Candidatus Acidoferrales bacterium]
MTKKVKASDLHPGDVLLYLFDPPVWDFPNWIVDKLIVDLDGGTYNHASIIDDSGKVVEATGKGIIKNSVQASIKNAARVDVWRLRDPKGGDLGSPGFDAKPVTDWANQFAAKDGGYAYDRLLLLAGITSSRRVDPSIGGKILELILEQAALLLDKIVSEGRVQMICSELVYRCYLGASQTSKDSRYLLNVPRALKPELASPLQTQASQFWAKYQAAKKNDPLPPTPEFVTPRDLETGKSLVIVGHLK